MSMDGHCLICRNRITLYTPVPCRKSFKSPAGVLLHSLWPALTSLHEQMHSNLLHHPPVERRSRCFRFLPRQKPHSNKHKVMWCSRPPHKAQISVWIFPPLDRELIRLAILPWYPKMPSLTKEDYNKFYETMHTGSTLQSAEGFVPKPGIHTVWPGSLVSPIHNTALAESYSTASLTAHWSSYLSFCSTSELQSLVLPARAQIDSWWSEEEGTASGLARWTQTLI